MTRWAITLAGLFLAAVVVMVVFAYKGWQPAWKSGETGSGAATSSLREKPYMEMAGVNLTHQSKDGVRVTLSMGDARVVRKKSGLFRIGGLRELRLTDFQVKIDASQARFTQGASPEQLGEGVHKLGRDIGDSLSSMTGTRQIAGLSVQHFRMECLGKDGRIRSVAGDRMTYDHRKNSFVIDGHVLVHLPEGTFQVSMGAFDRKRKVFRFADGRTVTLGRFLGLDTPTGMTVRDGADRGERVVGRK